MGIITNTDGNRSEQIATYKPFVFPQSFKEHWEKQDLADPEESKQVIITESNTRSQKMFEDKSLLQVVREYYNSEELEKEDLETLIISLGNKAESVYTHCDYVKEEIETIIYNICNGTHELTLTMYDLGKLLQQLQNVANDLENLSADISYE